MREARKVASVALDQGEKQKGGYSRSTETDKKKVHFAALIDICHLKNGELEPKYQNCKGRVVFRGDMVKDDSGPYTVFTQRGPSASRMASRGRRSPHRRVLVNTTADTLPMFQADYMFIRTVAESKTRPCITFVETRSGAVISFMCARKGGYEALTKEILRHVEASGFLNPVILYARERRERC